MSQRSHYQEVLHRTLSPPPHFRQRPPPHSWKSTINYVSSKPDTTPSPAHPLGDHYESVQACVPWPSQATHEERERTYILFYYGWKWDTVQMLLSFFSKKTLGINSGLYLSQLLRLKQRKKTLCDRGVLYFTTSVPPLLWAVTSAFPSVLREWHSSFVLESPHLIHGRLTPESGAVWWPFKIPASLIRWFLRHWITWPFVCSVSGWRGASALCELLTCKTCLKDTEWLMHWEDDCQQGHGERSVTPQGNKTATKGGKELKVWIEMSSNYSPIILPIWVYQYLLMSEIPRFRSFRKWVS